MADTRQSPDRVLRDKIRQQAKDDASPGAAKARGERPPEPEPESSRDLLLDAAMAEFGAKGLAGARVSEIAKRAGVNAQLISYYFGGKQGLYEAILERWYERETRLQDPAVSLAELTWRYFDVAFSQDDLQRLFIRETLEQDPSAVDYEPDGEDLVSMREYKRRGEIGEGLDPGFVLLMLQSMVVAQSIFPAEVKRLTGLDVHSPEFHEFGGEQIRRIVRRLGDAPEEPA